MLQIILEIEITLYNNTNKNKLKTHINYVITNN